MSTAAERIITAILAGKLTRETSQRVDVQHEPHCRLLMKSTDGHVQVLGDQIPSVLMECDCDAVFIVTETTTVRRDRA